MNGERWSPFASREPVDSVDTEVSSGMPLWFWLLPIAAIAAWWPLDCYWKSDDFLALHYARDFGNVLHDLHGPQYGATDVWSFLRPLITLSFWIDLQLGGGAPFVSHLSNVLAHGLSALLVGLLWTRALPRRRAFAAGLLWALLPSHAGSISWAVGRVDSHTTVWCLCCLWLFCRHLEGRRGSRPLSLLALLAALLSKESAFALPPLLLLLGFALHRQRGVAARLRAGLAASWPHLLLFGVYLGYRFWALGRLGGYAAAAVDPAAMATGFGHVTLDLLNPLRWSGAATQRELLGSAPVWLSWLGYVPALMAALLWCWHRRFGTLALALALFAIAALPTAAFWPAFANVHNLRYYYLPMAALAGIVAGAGWPLALTAIALWASAFVDVRLDYRRADRADAAMHRQLLREVSEGTAAPLFVAGLPHANASGTVVQLHFGIDRMLAPPFQPATTRLLALRPIADLPDAFRLTPPGDLPFALPAGTTLFFDGPDLLGRALPEALPVLAIDGGPDVDLGTARLQQLTDRSLQLQLRTPGLRAPAFRLTIFTATGYLCSVFPDHAAADARDGVVDLRRFFGGDATSGLPPARFARGGDTYVLRGLEVPITVDLVTGFPVLLEGGDCDWRTGSFVPTHRAAHLLQFRFDRDFPAWLRRVLNL